MKKILVFLFMLAGMLSLQAQTTQEYKIEFGCIRGETKPLLDYWFNCQFNVKIVFSDGSTYNYSWLFDKYSVGNIPYTLPPAYYTSKDILDIYYSYTCFKYMGTTNNEGIYNSPEMHYASSALEGYFTDDPCINMTIQPIKINAEVFDDYFFLKITPDYLNVSSDSQYITDCNNTVFSVTNLFNSPVSRFIFRQCDWEYSIGNSGEWTSFGTDQNTSISGSSIPNFASLVGKQQVRVRNIYKCNNTTSNILTLTPLICAPQLVAAEGISSCGSAGKIQITYNRPLYDGEYLSFVVYDNPDDPQGLFYGWNDPNLTKNLDQNEVTLSGLNPGTYKVRILSYMNGDTSVYYSDDSGNFSIGGVVIGAAPAPVLDGVESTSVTCPGNNDGTVTVTASGGSGSYYFELYSYGSDEPFKTSAIFKGAGTISGLPPDEYDVYLFDSGGCESETMKVAIVDEPDEFEIDNIELQSPTYDDMGVEVSDGSITADIYPYNNTYHFIWRSGSNTGTILLDENSFETSTLKNIPSGTYYLQVMNSFGCPIDSLIELTTGPKLTISLSQTGTISCSGDNTGELTASVTGGTAPYHYSWYKIDEYNQQETLISEANTNVLASIIAGRYRVRVEDATGLKATAVFVQTEENPLIASFLTDPLNCFSDTNGFLEINVSGGTPPYIYAWDNGATTKRIENLTAGDYGVKVTDNAGCFKQFTGVVAGSPPLEITAHVNEPACSGLTNGSISLQVNGGSPPYSYKWDDGSSGSSRNNLGAGNYWVEIVDSKACETVRREFTLNDPQPIGITLVSSQSITQFGLSNGSFSIKITGGATPYSITCLFNGSQQYSPASTQIQTDGSWLVSYNNLSEGVYTITVAGNNYQTDPLYVGCMGTIEVTITEPPLLSVTVEESHSITCHNGNDGTLIATGDGGTLDYVYEWFRVNGTEIVSLTSGTNMLNNLPEGVYVVKITDKNGVSQFSSKYNLLSPTALELTLNASPVTCAGGSNGQIEAVVTGGAGSYKYLWDTGETVPVISHKDGGTYSVTVTDQRGCQISGSATIELPVPFDVGYTVHPLSCAGLNDGGIQLDVQEGEYPPYTFLWSNGATSSSVDNLTPGEYTVAITDAKNCTIDLMITIPELKPITATLTEMKQPSGFGYSDGSIRMEITGGNFPYNVKWFKDNQDLSTKAGLIYEGNKAIAILQNISEGNYLIQIEDANYQSTQNAGCVEIQSFYMPQPPKLEVQIEQTHIITCNGGNDGTLISHVEGGVPFTSGLTYNYQWEKDSVFYETEATGISELGPGSYRLKITDANGIEAWSETVTINEPDPIVMQFKTADIKCYYDIDGWAEVSVTGGTPPYTYEWSTGDTTPRIENITRGKYMVKVTDANQCQATDMVEVIQGNAIQVNAQLVQPTCHGGLDGAIHISLSKGVPPYTYHWENNQQTLDYIGLSKGTYTFTVTDANGCSLETMTYELGEPDEIFVDLGEDRELCKGQTLTVEAKIPEPAASFTWYDSSQKVLANGATYTLSNAGTYTVKAITAKGCTAYGSITITRDDRDISADFIVASQVPVNDEVFVVNVATPAPESVEWILPDSGDYEVITENQQVLSLIFHDYGTYAIGLRSYSGKCWETVYKAVKVMDKFDIDNYEDADEPMLKSFTINPNPASQRFMVSIELKENAAVDLYLINSGTGVVSAHKHLSDNKVYNEWFDVPSASKGTYVVSLVAPKAHGVKKVILK
jgi:hypothetical protein